MTERACKKCRLISEGSTCPACGGKELTERWNSYLLIFDPEKSDIAKKIDAKVPGKYAVRIKG